MTTEYALEARGLGRKFGAFWAVKDVDLKVRRGSIHAMIGPNGAGKTTCFNLLTKTLQPSTGSIILNGVDISRLRTSDVATQGMARSFQISATFTQMTALENVRVALQAGKGTAYRFWRPLGSIAHLNTRAMELLENVGLQDSADIAASDLSYGKKRALEIATTLALDPQVMLLDEPQERMQMIEGMVSSLSDRITVLQAGQILTEGNYAEVSSDERVIAAYMGGVEDAL